MVALGTTFATPSGVRPRTAALALMSSSAAKVVSLILGRSWFLLPW